MPAAPATCFFFNDTATTEIYTLSLHDALPISGAARGATKDAQGCRRPRETGFSFASLRFGRRGTPKRFSRAGRRSRRSEEHTSELQSRQYLVCRLLLEKKN